MIVTTIWGTPTPDTAWRIPRLPCCSIKKVDADGLRARLKAGPLRVRLVTRVRTEWMPIPHLTGHLAGAEDAFTLFSGHVDAWHHGAMDNGSANATMLEVARLLSPHRGRAAPRAAPGLLVRPLARALRGLRVVRGPCVARARAARGPAPQRGLHRRQGRDRLHGLSRHRGRGGLRRGGGGRRDRPAGPRAAFLARGRSVVLGHRAAQRLHVHVPAPASRFGLRPHHERLFGTSGFPWWWHTLEDTIDKLDGDVLARDTRVFVASALRLCNAPVLPLGPARAARAVADTAAELQAAAGGRMDLASLVAAARGLAAALDDAAPGLAHLAEGDGRDTAAANRLLMRLSRVLVPLALHRRRPLRPRPRVGIPPLAGLQPVRNLPGMDAAADLTKFSLAALGRERNRAQHALDVASELAAELGTRVPQGEIR
jgi:hypothetical protein